MADSGVAPVARVTPLATGEPLWASLLDASPDCIKLLDPAGYVAYVNAAGQRLMDIGEAGAVEGTYWPALWPEDVRPQVRDAVSQARSGARARFQGPCLTLAGVARWWDVTITPVRDASGDVAQLLCVSRDITREKRAEVTVREAEAWERRLLETAHSGICTVDIVGRITFANRRFAEILGTTVAALNGRSLLALVEPGAAFAERTRFARRARGIAEVAEIPFVRADGAVAWLRTSMSSLFDDGNEFVGAVYVTTDVTAERDAEARLALSERYFRALIEKSSELITVLDADGTIRYGTPAYYELLGNTPEEVVGKLGIELVHPDDRPEVLPKLEALMREPGGTATAEYRAMHKDGSFRIVDSIARNLLDDPAVNGIVVNSRDVTDRRRVEEERRRQTELLEEIFAHIPAMITLVAPGGEALLANAEWERVTGWSQEDRRTPGFVDRMYPDSAQAAAVRAFFANARPDEWRDFRMTTRDGRIREATWTNVRLSDGSTLCFGRDVTEERRLGAQLRQAQKMEAIGRLTAGIAHDFNNLLQVISGNAYFAREALDPNHPATGDVTEIETAAERAAALTRQLLAFSRQQILSPQRLDLARVVGGMESLLRRTLGDDVAVRTVLDEDVVVVADQSQLEQVLMNLVVNARDAMPDGGELLITAARVQVATPHPDRQPGLVPGTYATLAVRDTGTGMDAATHARIFEPFFTTKEPGTGTGLGLATVYGIVKQSGGYVYADTAPGAGTTVTVLLPLGTDEPDADPAAPVSEGQVAGGTETILLAEDDAAVRASVSRQLTAAGYRVIMAFGGEDAIRILELPDAREIDLVLTDAVMPGASAREVVAAVARHCPTVPIIVMSGHSAELVMQRGPFAAGVVLLGKPFTPAQLLRHVRSTLDGQPAERRFGRA